MPKSEIQKLYDEYKNQFSLFSTIEVQADYTISTFRKKSPIYNDKDLVAEAILFKSYRLFEWALENMFLAFCRNRKTLGGRRSRSYLRPGDQKHARKLVKSSQPFLDWKPDAVLDRADIYLESGYPAKDPIASNAVVLRDIVSLRNHIAHDSVEAKSKYEKVILKEFTTPPMYSPLPGQFLRTCTRQDRSINYLEKYLKSIDQVISDIVTG